MIYDKKKIVIEIRSITRNTKRKIEHGFYRYSYRFDTLSYSKSYHF